MDTKQFLDKNGLPSSRKLAQPGVAEQLRNATPWMTPETPSVERLYALHHGLTKYPLSCAWCSHPVTAWKRWSQGYFGKHCSHKCYLLSRKQEAEERKKHIAQTKRLLTREERVARQEQSNLQRYGVRWPWMLEETKKQRHNRALIGTAKKWHEELTAAGYTPLFEVESYTGNRKWVQISHDKCGTIFKLQKLRWAENQQICPTCWSPRASKGQHDLADWIRSLGVKVRINDRKEFRGEMELDIYLPDHNLVIEYDGLYWHSERGRPDIKEKSFNKFLALKSRGFRHIMVFDDEWENRRKIVESRIKNAIGIIPVKIAARACSVKRLSSSEQHDFFERTHTQGGIRCAEALGLFYNDRLVAAMSFGKSRFSGRYNWELLRFATETDVSVVGGASKLFKSWRRMHTGESVVSFSDNRWGTGSFYTNLGFRYDGQTGQGYFYVNSNGKRRSRQQFMKHKLKDVFSKFDDTLSERDNCWQNGWYRVWDLGNTRWVIDG